MISLCFCIYTQAQTNIINVTEHTLKVAAMSEEMFYYGFAEGDQIIFNFQEMDNKELKELEILEYPSNSKFMEYKTKKIENKTITVLRTGVYAFRLSNSAILGRVCKIKIDRIPATTTTRLFNSAVKWVEKPDTTWHIYNKNVVVGYDTVLLHKTKMEMVKTETSEDLFFEQKETVHSLANPNGNKASMFFTVPTYPSMALIKKRVTALVYWIGVGDEANKQWEKNMQTIKSLARGASLFISPLGAYAIGAVADLATPTIGEDVEYSLVDEQNRNLFYAGAKIRGYDTGKGRAGFKKFTDPSLLSGTWYIVMSNDNYTLGISVNIKITVIIQTDYYEEQPYTEQSITARYESKVIKEPIITFNKVLVTVD